MTAALPLIFMMISPSRSGSIETCPCGDGPEKSQRAEDSYARSSARLASTVTTSGNLRVAVGLQAAALETGLVVAAGVNRRLYPAPSSVTTPVRVTTRSAGMARPVLPKNPRLKPSCPRPRRLQDPPRGSLG